MTLPAGFDTLHIENLIVHEVPKRVVGEGESLIISEVESPLNDEVRNFFQKSIQTALASGYELVFVQKTKSIVPAVVRAQLQGTAETFVTESQKLARNLYDAHTGATSAGLLCVARCTVRQTTPAFAILKLEREEGVRVNKDTIDGKTTLSVTHIQDLMLTQKTRVFKVAVFTEAMICACDSQHPATGALARYFLFNFLGCDLKESSDISTRKFMDAAEDFINAKVSDPRRRSDYYTALLAELSSNKQSLNPTNFANIHLKGPDRQKFIEHLASAKAPTALFAKDIGLIERRIEKIRYTFRSGAQVIAPKDEINKSVRIERASGDTLRIAVTGEVDSLEGK